VSMATQASPDAGVLLQARGIGKSFGGVDVLLGVDLDLHAGRAHALIGENGAGKSTFAKIVAGVHAPSRGSLRLAGTEVSIDSPAQARRLGIALIHQEPLSFPDLTVAENLWLGRTEGRAWSRVRRRAIVDDARRWLARLDAPVDPRQTMRELSIASQQLVEIARALASRSRLILMDEPTAALTPAEAARLFAVMRTLRAEGCCIVFISHRLDEVRETCEDVSVFRDGRLVVQAPVAGLDDDALIRHMIGRDPAPGDAQRRIRPDASPNGTVPPVLSVRALRGAGRVADIDLDVDAGSIVGIGGLVGAGRSELARALFGIAPARGGTIAIDGRERRIRAPRDAVRAGIGFVPEDRAASALFETLPLSVNIVAAAGKRYAPNGLLRRAAERLASRRAVEELRIRCASLVQPIGELSGGNQQKAILARWLLTEPRLLILDEPTRGIDVGAKAEFHELLRAYAARGGAVLVISSDLPELLALSDRVLVMCEGRLSASFDAAEATQERVMQAAVPRRGRVSAQPDAGALA